MKALMERVRRAAVAFHRDEEGAEGLEKILILAAVALPLLGLLIFFRNDLRDWLNSTWGAEKESGNQRLYGDGGTYGQ